MDTATFGKRRPELPDGVAHTEIKPFDMYCDRDWRHYCPLHWQYLNGRCLRPADYVGPCNTVEAQLTEEQKQSFASYCGVHWPCRRCTRDWTQCPAGWTLTDPSVHACKASNEYTGPCRNVEQSFLHFSVPQRGLWSQRCKTNRPCVA